MYELPHLQSLTKQIEILLNILKTNTELMNILEKARELEAPNWYIGAGAIAQTVWNYFHQFQSTQGIKDYDLVYFDPDTAYEAEDTFIQKGKSIFADVSHPVEIRNQARVHLWYKNHFGTDIAAHTCTEHAITTWPTTATGIGVRLNSDNTFTVFSPFGLHDVLGMIVRPNKVKITEQIYLDKVNRWHAVWPMLQAMSW